MADNYDSTADTLAHIREVNSMILTMSMNLMLRAITHDQSKLESPEKEIFDVMTPKLKNLVYGSEEYKASLKDLGPALTHHYQANPHHPEHFENGIAGFNVLDLVEMICDWIAAAKRTKDGDALKSLPHNIKRFNIEPQLANIIENTLRSAHG